MQEKIVAPSLKVILNVAVIMGSMFFKTILKKFTAVLDFVTTIVGTVLNAIKVYRAVQEYHEAQAESFNNDYMLKRYENIIKKHLEYEKCETLSEISFNQKSIDNHRLILKELFQNENMKISDIDQNDPGFKKQMSDFIDEACKQDVTLCIQIFNQKTLERYKDEAQLKKFREDIFYRSTRSAISSVSIANSKEQELLLLSMGKTFSFFYFTRFTFLNFFKNHINC